MGKNLCASSFDANGGKVGTSSTNIAMGEKYSLPTPERKYYSFDGWYTEKMVALK